MTTTKGMETPLPYMGPTLFPCHMAYLLTPPDEKDEEERPDDGTLRNTNMPSTPSSAPEANREVKQLSSPLSSPFPLSDTLSVENKYIPDLATLRDQAHSPLFQYEYVAVAFDGSKTPRKDGDDQLNGKSISHVGLALMPSSVPPAMDLYEKDADGKDVKKTPVAPHDWRRLQDVDLDDIVAQYGIQATSTSFLDQRSGSNHEPFRYGAKDREPTSGSLPTVLKQRLESLTKSGRSWHKQTVKARQKSHPSPTFQTQLPLSSKDWRNSSPLDLGAPKAAREQRLTPRIKPWEQIVGQKGKGPATEMRLYLSNVQSDLEQRMIQQLRVQAAFDPKHWAGSAGEKELIRLEERHKAFVEDLESRDNTVDCPPVPSPEEQPSSTKRHSKYSSPPPQKQIRRILVVWDTYSECHVLDQLPASFLNQFHGWVDIYKVSAPLLRVQSGFTVGKDHYSQHAKPIALKDMMRVLGFRPGYSLPTIVQSPYFNSNPEPGMNAVRMLGVLARLVAYPATVISTLEVGRKKQTREFWDCLKKVKKNKRKREQKRERAVPEEMAPQPFYCVIVRAVFAEDKGQEGQEQGTQEPRDIDTDDDDDAYATLPNNFHKQSDVLKFLHARGLNGLDDVSFRYERLDLSPHPSRFCVHFDTLEQATAAKYAFNLTLRRSPIRLHAWIAGS